MSRMFNPAHPGETLREHVLPVLGLSVTGALIHLGVTRTAFSRAVHGRAAVSPKMARRNKAGLGPERGACAEIFLGMQMAQDL
jgi:addiction module HigA family antidote